jgi:hypothetical protein
MTDHGHSTGVECRAREKGSSFDAIKQGPNVKRSQT